MAIQYKVVTKRPGGFAGENTPRYYPVLTKRRTANLREVMELISERSAFSRADVIGVVESLIHLIPELLQGGNNVKLDGLGTFSVHARSDGRDHAEEVTLRDIKELKISFLPDKQIKKQMKSTKFTKVK